MRVEGGSGHTWRVLDYGAFIVHVMEEKTREFYGIERLWNEGTPVTYKILPKKPSRKKKAAKKKVSKKKSVKTKAVKKKSVKKKAVKKRKTKKKERLTNFLKLSPK